MRRCAHLFRSFWNRTLAAALLIVWPYAAGRGLPPAAPPPPRFVPIKTDIHVIAVWPRPDSNVARPVVAEGASAGDTTLLSKTADAVSVAPDGRLTYTIAITNATNAGQTFRITDTLPSALSYITGTATGGLVYNAASTSLTATRTLSPFLGDVILTTGAPPYTETAGTFSANICQSYFPQCDDNSITLGGVSFRYLGVDYTTVTLDSNGFVIPGSVDPGAANLNQHLPDPAVPNGVIAPFWADLDLKGSASGDPGGGDWFYAVLHDVGTNADYFVVEWRNAQKKNDGGTSYSFEVWIQLHAEHITFAYDHLTGSTSSATIGFENSNGTLGHSYLYNGTGSVPAPGDKLGLVAEFDTAQFGFGVRAHHDLRGCLSLTNTVILSNAPGTIITSTAAASNVFGPCLSLPLISR
jgi:uncharacterized repeat protein (TIGR01451 family)